MQRIDLIIDALESAHHTNDTVVMGLTKLRLDTALAAARELKALKPVAKVILTEHLGMPIVQWVDLDRSFELDSGALLYALDEVNHD